MLLESVRDQGDPESDAEIRTYERVPEAYVRTLKGVRNFKLDSCEDVNSGDITCCPYKGRECCNVKSEHVSEVYFLLSNWFLLTGLGCVF